MSDSDNRSCLLLNLELEASERCGINLGLASIATACRQHGIGARQDYISTLSDCDRVCDAIREDSIAVVGISVVDSQIAALPRILPRLFSAGAEHIVIGGPTATLWPDALRTIAGISIIVRGAGEIAFPRLCREFLDNPIGSYATPVITPVYAVEDRASWAEPWREPWYQRIIAEDEGEASFMFSRGCAGACRYCCNSALRGVRALPEHPLYVTPAKAIDQIVELKREFRFSCVHLHDDNFGLDDAWRRRFLEYYTSRVGLPFSCNRDPSSMTPSVAQELASHGCWRVAMGVECGNETLRRSVGRPISNDAIRLAFRSAREADIATTALVMLGLPGETQDTLTDTAALIADISPDEVCVYYFYPYYGTTLRPPDIVVAGYGERKEPIPGLAMVSDELLVRTRSHLESMGASHLARPRGGGY